ncbi:FHA domain-containing protein [Saccharothrix syringae]|uniref:FHA domain-containing protein n=1 Tax=Saccharothrix syringae TaxID=103733 RepID=A0A5Q0H2R9_SACSY|nr:FHA domain-containing protein [Saccharothrix syringae]QFZ20002.1 FHA domain-containing protein [Saccharothrix syringae]
MVRCPAGHGSTTEDFCDVCGAPISGEAAPAAAAPGVPPGVPPEGACAACGAARVGRFCEECGHDSLRPATPVAAPVTWHVTVAADRAHFDRVVVAAGGPDAAGVEFPRFCPERRFELGAVEVSIGRRSRSRGTFPGIDLVGPPEDPGVSHHHALLVPSDGGWAVVDLGSTNGTTVNDATEPLRPHQPHPLVPGDRVHVGAWTTVTLHSSGG